MWTDQWRAYLGIQNMGQGYIHLTVNHSANFVDPNTGVCTNAVEGFWSQAKKKFKRMFGTYEALLPAYLDEWYLCP